MDKELDSSQSPGISSDDNNDITEHCHRLTEGLFQQILPQMRTLHDRLGEVDKSQKVLIDSLQQENERILQWNPNQELEIFMEEVKHYRSKLISIRKNMLSLSERCSKMKRRVEKVKVRKDKETLKEQEKKRKLEEKERELIAKSSHHATTDESS